MKILFIIFIMISCNKTDLNIEILGKWFTKSNNGENGYFIFNPNGELELSSIKLNHKIKWKIKDNILLLSHNGNISDSLIISDFSNNQIALSKPSSKTSIILYKSNESN